MTQRSEDRAVKESTMIHYCDHEWTNGIQV